MSQYWSDIVQQLDPYVPGEQPQDQQYIKLNTNENPYPPTPKVVQSIIATRGDSLGRYPDPEAKELLNTLAKFHDVATENIFLGNGSDEVLAHTFHAFFQQKPVAYPDICYSFYPVYSQLYQCAVNTIPLDERFCINPDDYTALDAGIIFPNPNAPTSLYLGLDAIEAIAKSSNHIVVIDEAYIDFGNQSAVELTKQYDNLLVIQTFSKSRSLAGLRIGYAIGHKDLIEGLNRVKNSFNSYPIDCITQAAAIESIKDNRYFEMICDKVIHTREATIKSFKDLGFEVLPSATNFIMAKHPEKDAETLYLKLKAKGILVRYFKQPRIDDYLRITIGKPEDMQTLVQTIHEFD